MPLAPALAAPLASPCAWRGGTTRGWLSCSATPCGDQLRVDLGVLDLEDVQLDLLAGQLLEVAADAVGLRRRDGR
jgi:hypothetical protein